VEHLHRLPSELVGVNPQELQRQLAAWGRAQERINRETEKAG
jgi:hypothetical protein